MAAGVETDLPLHGVDPAGAVVSYRVVGDGVLGSASPSADGVTYRADPESSGTDYVVVRASNGQFSSAPATIAIHISAVRVAPFSARGKRFAPTRIVRKY